MRGKLPVVREYMTRLPIEFEHCETVGDAIEAMESFGIRHIPVMNGSHLKGLVSQRDILQAQVAHGAATNRLPLKQICQTNLISVTPVTPINEVAELMLASKVGSAIVLDGGFVVGIFTSTDALRVLSEIGKA